MAEVMVPAELVLHQVSQCLELVYESGERYSLPAEYLRVYSPSAAVRGHHPSQAVLQTGKRAVQIQAVEPVGNYAVRLRFDDLHDTGIYTFRHFAELGRDHDALWARYLAELAEKGLKRER